MRPFIVAALLAALASPGMAQAPQRRESGNLVTENVPETPPEVRESLRRYQNARSASFMDWMPDGTMLIATRFGSTPQLHHVKAPGGDRQQLTFFDEPIADAEARPTPPAQVIFSRDTGGDEYFQGYAFGLSGPEIQITEPKTRNVSMVFSPLGDRLAWSRVTPGSGDYDIMVMDSGDIRTRKVALEGKGAIFPIAFDRDARRLLLGRTLSSTAGQRFLLDLATGRLTELNRSKVEIAYGGGQFTPDGRHVLFLSDE
ncbi:MAG TPA: S9 family peptidase, partial [Phenylobacterium sp.]|nr:S9 family peptidase [Phenylobacterium sp.]